MFQPMCCSPLGMEAVKNHMHNFCLHKSNQGRFMNSLYCVVVWYEFWCGLHGPKKIFKTSHNLHMCVLVYFNGNCQAMPRIGQLTRLTVLFHGQICLKYIHICKKINMCLNENMLHITFLGLSYWENVLYKNLFNPEFYVFIIIYFAFFLSVNSKRTSLATSTQS